MKLSRTSLYAIYALTHMATLKLGAVTASHVMAQTRDLPEQFLVKVLNPLLNARIVVSVKGPHGGFRLGRPAKDISLLEIVETVDGPIRSEPPDISANGKPSALTKQLAKVYDEAAKQIRKTLAGVTLAGLVGKK